MGSKAMMSNKSLRKDYEFKRSYDFVDFWSPAGKRFTKKVSHKRVRSRFNKATKQAAMYESE